MKRSQIKVGEVYGVRYKTFGGYGSEPVPARVVDIDAPTEWATPGYLTLSNKRIGGGIRVEFVEPTRLGYSGFALAKKTNENAGKIQKAFVFHDDLPGCGGSVGRCFVGLWKELEDVRKAEVREEREELERWAGIAEKFAPVLSAYREKLAKTGLKTSIHGDGSGVHGDVKFSLYATTIDKRGNRAATGFAYGDVHLPKPLFDQVLDFAIEHGFVFDTKNGED